jgi:hypothetical protein
MAQVIEFKPHYCQKGKRKKGRKEKKREEKKRKDKMDWQSGSSSKSACLRRMRS